MQSKHHIYTVLAIILLIPILVVGCGKSEEAQKVETLITEIGEVSVNSGDAINTAETSYNLLSDKHKQEVENYSVLVEAKAAYDKAIADSYSQKINALASIPTAADIATLKVEYDKLTDEQKRLVEGYEKIAILDTMDLDKLSRVQEKINATTGYSSFSQIIEAKEGYESLTADEKNYITNYDKIEDLAELKDQDKPGIVAAHYLRGTLKNPDSLKIQGIRYRPYQGFFFVVINYSAKNSFGGEVTDSICIDVLSKYSIGFIGMSSLTGKIDETSNLNYKYFLEAGSKVEKELDPEKILYYIDENVLEK